MNLSFDINLAKNFKSSSQIARVLTEAWVGEEIFCPNCGNDKINHFPNGQKVADFYCQNCREEYELKSKKNNIGGVIVDGEYNTMIQRISSSNNPDFFFLNYDVNFNVKNFLIIPKHFFVPDIIIKRKPLSDSARRAGWTGCNIVLSKIPDAGKVFYIKNGVIEKKEVVLKQWEKVLFLRDETKIESKGWILDIMSCLDRLNKKEFLLDDVYSFESDLKIKHPDNNFIKDKIRQQLQILRDKNYLEFVGRGKYKII